MSDVFERQRNGPVMPRCTRHKTIMTIDRDRSSDPDAVMFSQKPDTFEPDEVLEAILIDKGLWREMDRPEVITVTVEPGDLLQDGAEG